MRRVVITGVGAVSPLGNDARAMWEAALSGTSGIDYIQAFDTEGFDVKIAGEVKDLDTAGLASPKDVKRLDRNVLFALGAAKEALGDAGVNGYDPERVGVVVGCCIGGVNERIRQHDNLRGRGAARGSPHLFSHLLVDPPRGPPPPQLGILGAPHPGGSPRPARA